MGDDIYMRTQIYNPLFSCNTDNLVDQVFQEISAPSGWWLEDQEKKVKVSADTFLYMQLLKEIVDSSHKVSQNRHQVEY